MTDTTSPWTVEDVANRFAEAAWTAHRLPRVGPRGYFNPWMTTAFQVPDRYPDSERLYRPMLPSPQDVERMLEAMRWVQWLEVEQRHLVWMRAKRYGWRDITIRFACDRSTAWRRWQRALEIVATNLNGEGVRPPSKNVGNLG